MCVREKERERKREREEEEERVCVRERETVRQKERVCVRMCMWLRREIQSDRQDRYKDSVSNKKFTT